MLQVIAGIVKRMDKAAQNKYTAWAFHPEDIPKAYAY